MFTVQGYFLHNIAPQGRSEANEMSFHIFFVLFWWFWCGFWNHYRKERFSTQKHNGENFSPIKIDGKNFPHPEFAGKFFPIFGEKKHWLISKIVLETFSLTCDLFPCILMSMSLTTKLSSNMSPKKFGNTKNHEHRSSLHSHFLSISIKELD